MAEKDNTRNKTIRLEAFPRQTLLDIKDKNDKVSGRKEWLGHLYMHNGKVLLGEAVTGDYNGITIEPYKQMEKDKVITGIKECVMATGESQQACVNIVKGGGDTGKKFFGGGSFGAQPEDLIATIHLHPMKSASEFGRRSKFSGIDIGSEFAKCRDNDRPERLFLTYPKFKGSRRGNEIKMISFPSRKDVMAVMKASHPHMSEDDIMKVDQDGRNIDMYDWVAYQDEAEKRGHIQTLDIEESTGVAAYATEARNYIWLVVLGTVGALGVAYYINRRRKYGR